MKNTLQLFIQDPVSKRIRITKGGVEKYGTKFAIAGYNIHNIRTMAEFENAVEASFAIEMQTLAQTAKGKNIDLDNIMNGLPGWD
ncbi:MAG: hypothetical protein QM504_11195 [Pseudomonadota bacterium]